MPNSRRRHIISDPYPSTTEDRPRGHSNARSRPARRGPARFTGPLRRLLPKQLSPPRTACTKPTPLPLDTSALQAGPSSEYAGSPDGPGFVETVSPFTNLGFDLPYRTGYNSGQGYNNVAMQRMNAISNIANFERSHDYFDLETALQSTPLGEHGMVTSSRIGATTTYSNQAASAPRTNASAANARITMALPATDRQINSVHQIYRAPTLHLSPEWSGKCIRLHILLLNGKEVNILAGLSDCESSFTFFDVVRRPGFSYYPLPEGRRVAHETPWGVETPQEYTIFNVRATEYGELDGRDKQLMVQVLPANISCWQIVVVLGKRAMNKLRLAGQLDVGNLSMEPTAVGYNQAQASQNPNDLELDRAGESLNFGPVHDDGLQGNFAYAPRSAEAHGQAWPPPQDLLD